MDGDRVRTAETGREDTQTAEIELIQRWKHHRAVCSFGIVTTFYGCHI